MASHPPGDCLSGHRRPVAVFRTGRTGQSRPSEPTRNSLLRFQRGQGLRGERRRMGRRKGHRERDGRVECWYLCSGKSSHRLECQEQGELRPQKDARYTGLKISSALLVVVRPTVFGRDGRETARQLENLWRGKSRVSRFKDCTTLLIRAPTR